MNTILESAEMRDVPEEGATAPDLKAQWLDYLARATCPANGLKDIAVPTREVILGDWLMQGDLGFIYGPRGLGKTWLAMLLARRCAEGGMVANWTTPKPRRVLYVDGEMPLDGIRARDAALASGPDAPVFYLQHEALFYTTGQVLNLTDLTVQAALLAKCKQDGIEVLFLDNLSCLFAGIKENDANDWEKVLPWLLELRRERIAVVFIAHAGRNGLMRGTSRREDAAFWIIHLAPVQDAGEVQTGARFVARFVKNRNATEATCPPMEWQFVKPDGEALARVTFKMVSTFQLFRQCLEDGLTGATDIADEMGISKGQVSKMAKRGIKEGWLKKDGRDYGLTGQA
jgi:hypothetical protein